MTLNIKVYKDLMGANDEWAGRIKQLLASKHIRMYNLIGAPGCGKTALLESLCKKLPDTHKIVVLEGDVETTRDAERIASLGIKASQLLTGGACHLEAKLVYHALVDILDDKTEIVFVENVGNLVCPAEFDIGETAKIAVLSVTEGEDKPLKYPLLFHVAKAVVVTKCDLLPYLDFNLQLCEKYINQVHHRLPVFKVSAKNGTGLEELVSWLLQSKT